MGRCSGCQQDLFLTALQECFHRIGYFIAKHPLICILFTLITLCSSYGCIYLRFASRLQDGFTTTDAPWRYEEAVFDGMRNASHVYTQRFVVLVRAGDNGSMLRPEYLQLTSDLHHFLSDEFKPIVDGARIRHADLCRPLCNVNKALDAIQESQKLLIAAENQGLKPPIDIIIDHPKSMIHGYEYNVAFNLFGITKNHNHNHNHNHHRNNTRLDHVAVVVLIFQAETLLSNVTHALIEWEMAVFEWVKQGANEFPQLTIDVMGDKVLGREMTRGAISVLPHLFIGLILTSIFVVVMVCGWEGRRGLDSGKVLIASGIILSPLFAVLTTFGIMGFMGPIYPIQMVVPFIILAIGVDDAFLMLHAWNRLIHNEWPVNGEEDNRERIPKVLGLVLAEIGPSITITSLTNAIAFGIGTTVTTPAIRMFCMSATIAMIIDFVYELTFFGSLLSLSGHMNTKRTVVEKMNQSSFAYRKHIPKYLRIFCRILLKPTVRTVIFLFTAMFFVASLWGTLRIRTHIDSQRIIPSDSRLLQTDRLLQRYMRSEYEPLIVIVNDPPDIANKTAYGQLRQMIRDFETLPNALGPSFTLCWLNDFEQMLHHLNSVFSVFKTKLEPAYDEVPDFLSTFYMWNDTIRWHREADDSVKVTQFYFIVVYGNTAGWMDRANLLIKWRQTAAEWSIFNVTVFTPNAPVYDGIFAMKWTTIQTASLTVVCMIGVCILFIPSIAGVLTAGVFGFFSWWGMDLDPITMSAIVMTLGLSVDFTAHVSFHFQRSRQTLPESSTSVDHLQVTLEAIGWPTIQAAFSTLLCFLPVAFHPDYTPSVFVRTIVLVVTIGLIHGLILLPAILVTMPDCLFVTMGSQKRVKHLPETVPPLVIDKIVCEHEKETITGLKPGVSVCRMDKEDDCSEASSQETAATSLLSS